MAVSIRPFIWVKKVLTSSDLSSEICRKKPRKSKVLPTLTNPNGSTSVQSYQYRPNISSNSYKEPTLQPPVLNLPPVVSNTSQLIYKSRKFKGRQFRNSPKIKESQYGIFDNDLPILTSVISDLTKLMVKKSNLPLYDKQQFQYHHYFGRQNPSWGR